MTISLTTIPSAVSNPAVIPFCMAFFSSVKNTGPKNTMVPIPVRMPLKIAMGSKVEQNNSNLSLELFNIISWHKTNLRYET
jgi:hypothetical protein